MTSPRTPPPMEPAPIDDDEAADRLFGSIRPAGEARYLTDPQALAFVSIIAEGLWENLNQETAP